MLAFFVLTFAISWGGVLLVIGGPVGIPGTREELDTLFPFALVAMLAGPGVAGILLTGLVHGRSGLRAFVARLLTWRVGARWHAVALLTAPLVMLGVLLALSLFSREFLPGVFVSDDRATLLLSGLAVGLAAGVFEELGWTGFVTPALRLRYGVLATGLVVGLAWAAWHLLVAFWASGTVSGSLALASYVLDPFLFLVVFRVLMVWVYDRTGSLLVAMLMHAGLTAGARIIGAPAMAGLPLLTFDLVWAAVLWTLVAAVAAATREPRRYSVMDRTPAGTGTA